MNFDTSEEQELLQDTIGKWASRECPPTRVREIFDGDATHDPALWQGLCELGVAGLVVPEAHGGIGFTWECDVQIWFKRIMQDRAFLGMPSIHRERAAKLAGW